MADDRIEKWQDSVPDIDVEGKLLNVVDEDTYLKYRRKFERPDDPPVKQIRGIGELLSILKVKPGEVELRETQLIKCSLKARQDRLQSRLSSKLFQTQTGRRKLDPHRRNVRNRGGQGYTAPNKLPELILNALSDWDPAPHRLLISKMRAELDNKSVPVESAILSDSFLQAEWLEEFLDLDESTGQIHIRNAVRRHWGAIGDKLEYEVADYAFRLSGEVLKQNTSTVMHRFWKLNLEANRRDILLHLTG